MRLITGQTSRRAAGPDPERDPNWLFFFFFLLLLLFFWSYFTLPGNIVQLG